MRSWRSATTSTLPASNRRPTLAAEIIDNVLYWNMGNIRLAGRRQRLQPTDHGRAGVGVHAARALG